MIKHLSSHTRFTKNVENYTKTYASVVIYQRATQKYVILQHQGRVITFRCVIHDLKKRGNLLCQCCYLSNQRATHLSRSRQSYHLSSHTRFTKNVENYTKMCKYATSFYRPDETNSF